MYSDALQLCLPCGRKYFGADFQNAIAFTATTILNSAFAIGVLQQGKHLQELLISRGSFVLL
jgi:hypothetical protein